MHHRHHHQLDILIMTNNHHIDYKCTVCEAIEQVDSDVHKDSTQYYECDCGELMLPANSEDFKTKDILGLC